MNDKKPKVNSEGEKELQKVEQQFNEFDKKIQDMTDQRMNAAPNVEPQTKMAQSDVANSKDIYLKPKRTLRSQEPFNERYRAEYEFAKEYVYFIAENREIKGEDITLWTKKFPGAPCEEWVVPVNKPVWGPRYLAEQLKSKYYHRLKSEDRPTGQNQMGYDTGMIVVDTTIQRLDAIPATKQRSIFMGSNKF